MAPGELTLHRGTPTVALELEGRRVSRVLVTTSTATQVPAVTEQSPTDIGTAEGSDRAS